MYDILLLDGFTSFQSETATSLIKGINSVKRLALPQLVDGYFKGKYTYTGDHIVSIEKQCEKLVKTLTDSEIIIPYVSKEEAMSIATDYVLWALKQRFEPYKTTNDRVLQEFVERFYNGEYKPIILDLISQERGKEGVKNYFNIKDLTDLEFPKIFIPDNLTVWFVENSAGVILSAYSEYNRDYKKICVYR